MNYEKQIRAFEKMMKEDPNKLPKTAQILWYRLMNHGTYPIKLSVREISALISVTDKTALVAIDDLVYHKLIEYHAGVKGNVSEFKIKRLY